MQLQGYEDITRHNTSRAIEYFIRSKEIFLRINDFENGIRNDLYLLDCFKRLHLYEKFWETTDFIKSSYPDSLRRKFMHRIFYNEAKLHREMGHYKQALVCLDSSTKYCLADSSLKEYYTRQVLSVTGMCYMHLSEYERAISCYKKSINELIPLCRYDSLTTSTNLINLSNAYRYVHDYNQALLALRKAELLASPYTKVNTRSLFNVYLGIGLIKNRMSDPIGALQYFDLAKSYLVDDEFVKMTQLSLIFHNKGCAHIKLRQYNSAAIYLHRAENMAERFELSSTNDIYRDLANLYKTTDNYTLSANYFEKVVGHEIIDSTQNRQWYESMLDYATLQLDYDIRKGEELLGALRPHVQAHLPPTLKIDYCKLMGDYQERQFNYEDAITLYEIADSIQKSELVLKHGFVFVTPELIEFYEKYCLLLSRLSISRLGISENHYSEAFKSKSDFLLRLIQQLLMTSNDFNSKVFLSSKYNKTLNHIISAWLLMSTKIEKEKFEGHLFHMLNFKKSILTQGLLQENIAKEEGILPDSIRAYESYLRSQLTNHYKYAFGTDGFFENRDDKSSFGLTQYAARYDSLMGAIENKYPSYYKLKYGQTNFDLPDVQKQLSDGEIIFDYSLMGDSIIITQVIEPTQYSVSIDTINDEFLSMLVSYQKIFNDQSLKSFSAHDFNSYKAAAQFLYDKLMSRHFGSVICRNITIIPDGILSSLSFDALLTEGGDQIEDFKSLPYLIKDATIKYSYSIPSFLSVSQQLAYNESVMSVFSINPYLQPEEEDLEPLLLSQKLWYSEKEADQIQSIFGGQAIDYSNMTKGELEQIMKKHTVLHIATHSERNRFDPLLSSMLPPSDADDQPLYAIDIMNLDLNSNLVILSGCNTGIGPEISGEGLFSIAKAFYIAGCNSALITLNKIEDHATEKIVTSFFKHLKNGQSPAISLRLAKLEYLESASHSESHPFYWSSFAFVGGSDQLNNTRWNFVIIGIAITAIIVGILMWRRRLKSIYHSEA